MAVSVALSPVAILQFFDNTGKPAIGGTLTTQVGGINYATYSDPLGATPLPNPIPLNSRGEVSTAAGASSELFLQTGVTYTFILKDSAGNQLWSVGNISAINGQAVSFPTASGSANAQIITNAVPISLGVGTIQWFLPVAANTGATTINVDNTGAKNAFWLSRAFAGGELQIGIPAQIIYDGTQWNLVNSAKGPATDYYVDTGSVNAPVILINMAQGSTTAGIRFRVKMAFTTTSSAPLITINGAGPLSIYLVDRVTLPPAGCMAAGQICDFIYDNVFGAAILQNPQRVTGSFTGTLTGMTGATTGTINYSIALDGKTVYAWNAATITGTSNTTAMTMTGIPAALSCTTNKRIQFVLMDNGTNTVGNMQTGTSTTWTFGNAIGNTGMTSGSTKGFNLTTQWTFTLD